jgi:hypothetical protein
MLLLVAIPLQAQYALDFDGVDDYSEVPHDTIFDFTNELTAEIYFLVDAVPMNNTNLFTKVVVGVYASFGICFMYGDLKCGIYGPVAERPLSIPGDSVSIGVWNHVAISYDGSMMRFYLNGVEMDSIPGSGDILNDPTPISFGRFSAGYGHYFDGKLDEARLWNIGRTGDEIRSTMSAELTGHEEGLVGYWKFNEGVGDTIFDSSPLGNNGQLGSISGPDESDPAWTDHDFPSFLPVVFSIAPTGPITIPIGGILEFSTYIQNNREHIVEGDYWLSVQLPNMSEFLIPDGLLNYPNPLSGQVFPLGTVELSNELWVHPRADTGSYQLIGRIGQYPDIIGEEDSFGFRVVE